MEDSIELPWQRYNFSFILAINKWGKAQRVIQHCPIPPRDSYFRLCSFSLQAHKENEPKEMRFAAVQIPAKIGARLLNGEKLDVLNTFRTSSNSSPFFTRSHRRFLNAAIYKAAEIRTCPVLSKPLDILIVVGTWGSITAAR